MAKLAIKPGSTDVTLYVFVPSSAVTTGAGLTGLAFNTTNLVFYYVRQLENETSVALVTQTTTGAHTDGGFVEVDATNVPGIYRLDLPDAMFATGVRSVVGMLKGAANMAPVVLEVDLTTGSEISAILALLDDARGEPAQGAPPVNPDLATKLDYLYKAWRNKKDNNGSETKLYADNGTTVDHKQTTSETAGTVTVAEWITGA